MNPLNHFGIKNIMIRGDTKSYNKNATCRVCGKDMERPIRKNKFGWNGTCDDCFAEGN
jgi:hypothetical protein